MCAHKPIEQLYTEEIFIDRIVHRVAISYIIFTRIQLVNMAQASLILSSTKEENTAILKQTDKKQCDFCEKQFKTKKECGVHLEVVHCPIISTCKLCKQICTSPLALRNHIKKHQNLKCHICEKQMNGFYLFNSY